MTQVIYLSVCLLALKFAEKEKNGICLHLSVLRIAGEFRVIFYEPSYSGQARDVHRCTRGERLLWSMQCVSLVLPSFII